jgi:uncharacterized oxidoreductase
VTVSDAEIVVESRRLQDFVEEVVRGFGATAAVAGVVARHLVGANLSGHDSHGVLRLTQYLAELDRGDLHPEAEPVVLRESAVAALFDAGRGFGQYSTMAATTWVIDHARGQGIAAAAVRHSNHIGRLGEYSERIAEAGLVGMVTVGVAGPGASSVAPFGGAARFLGTNPWSIAVPANGRPPMFFDGATSTVAEGKVRLARAKGVPVPEGAVRDAAGRLSTDPDDLYDGGSLTVMGGTVAGHKGFGLSLAAALVGGLSMIDDGDPTSGGTGRFPAPDQARLGGVFVMAIDPGAFGDADMYRADVSKLLAALGEVPPQPGVERVLVPGDPERSSRERRLRDGIPIPRATWEDLAGIASRFRVELPRA